MQHSLQDTGVESSDQEEARVRREIDKMNAIISSKNKTHVVPALRPKNAILEGGWL